MFHRDLRRALLRSVLLDVIAGTRAPLKGYVTLDDRDLRDLSPAAARDRIGLIRSPCLALGFKSPANLFKKGVHIVFYIVKLTLINVI